MEDTIDRNINDRHPNVDHIVSTAFKMVSPCWSLKNIIAVNPLRGFENMPFERAVEESYNHFQKRDIPIDLEQINRETIKWCQLFFDEGQSTIAMPFRTKGLYQCIREFAPYDSRLHKNNKENKKWIQSLPSNSDEVIIHCLNNIGLNERDYDSYVSMLITSLPGWASYIKFRTEWSPDNPVQYNITQKDYIALRMIIACLLASDHKKLLEWHLNSDRYRAKEYAVNSLDKIYQYEIDYRNKLLSSINSKWITTRKKAAKAQLIFCIDVRSEPLRRAIENCGNYETFGFAGFYGAPVNVINELSEESSSQCPVLMTAKHTIHETVSGSSELKKSIIRKNNIINTLHHTYQMLKYMFSTPFNLVEMIGPWCGLWMLIRTISPTKARKLKERFFDINTNLLPLRPELSGTGSSSISINEQCIYAENLLRIIGLTKQFSPLIILCGHTSDTENNAYHTALNCGACGGHSGGPNARIMASILNNTDVRERLLERNISIPHTTQFISATHITTTDDIIIHDNMCEDRHDVINDIQLDLSAARNQLSLKKHGNSTAKKLSKPFKDTDYTLDWAQTRPEWGLAKNAAFIVGPRSLTDQTDLQGRVFLHSYDWLTDVDGNALTSILTAPLIVAQWINCQYLFSTIDNTAYGSGSKVTHNITGKIGVMQGNASDLMHGLPRQSVFKNDHEHYHEPQRLLAVIHAPRPRIKSIIENESVLHKLVSNQWISISCLDPVDGQKYIVTPKLDWIPVAV